MINIEKSKEMHISIYGICKRNNEMLMVLKNRGPYKGKWGLPGGGIEFGELILEALIREFKEEIGVPIKVGNLVDIKSNLVKYVNNVGQYEELYHIGIFYNVSLLSSIDVGKKVNFEDVEEYKWIDIEKIDYDNLTPFVEHLIKNFK